MPGMVGSTVNTDALDPRATPPSTESGAGGQREPEGAASEDFERGLTAMMRMLYDGNGIEGAVKQVEAASNLPEGLSDTVFQLMTTLDERSGGQIPDEDLGQLARETLGMVVDAVHAAGVDVKARDVVQALNLMVTRFALENGADPEQIRQAQSQINLDGIAAQAGGADDTAPQVPVTAPTQGLIAQTMRGMTAEQQR